MDPTIAEMIAIMFSWSCQMAVALSPWSSSSNSDEEEDDEDEDEDQHWDATVESRR